MNEPVLVVDQLVTRVRGADGAPVTVLDGVGFTLRRGETFAIVGESGCGKSLTALSLMRLLPESAQVAAGQVCCGDTDLLALPESEMRRWRGQRIAMIFQEPGTSLNPVLTLGEQIGEVLRREGSARLTRAQERSRVVELLQSVGIAEPAQRLDEYPFQLSGGMRQRAMIAMALALEPDVLIADEPTTALDVTIQAQVLELLAELQQRRQTAILLITHDLGVVAGMAHQVGVMYAGQLVEVASREAFFAGPRHPYSRKLLAALPDLSRRDAPLAVIAGQVPAPGSAWSGCRFADRCDAVIAACRLNEPTLRASGNEGHAVRCLRDALPPMSAGGASALATAGPAGVPLDDHGEATGAPGLEATPHRLLELDRLAVHFPIRRGLLRRVVGQVRAVDGVSLSIGRGQTLALVGESGCGKTTVGKAILGLVRATGGMVRFDGDAPARFDRAALRRYRRRVQIVFQDPFGSLDPRMSVGEIVMEGLRAQSIGANDEARLEQAAALLERVGLPAAAIGRYPHEFSGGQRQRLAIARALAVGPDLLVCDEPTSALDVSVQAQILNLLRRLQRELGLACLFITHNLAAVAWIADRVAVMYLGRIVEEGPVADVLARPAHPYTRALLSAAPTLGPKPQRILLPGEMPSPVHPPSGCAFHPRCAEAEAACRAGVPAARWVAPGHAAACLHVTGAEAP